jgi:PAS domain S-box-containing protein
MPNKTKVRLKNAHIQEKNQSVAGANYSAGDSHYHEILESMHGYAVISTDKNGQIQTWSKGAEKLFGYAYSEVINKHVCLLYNKGDQDKESIHKEFQAANKNGKTENERIHVKKDGGRFWAFTATFPLHINKKTAGYTIVFRDFTKRQKEKEEREKFISLVEHSEDFIALADLEHKTLYLNKAGQDIVGLEDDAIDEIELADFFSKSELKRVEEQILPVLLDKGSWYGEVLFRNFKTNNEIPMLWNVYTIKNPESTTVSYACVARNITDRKKSEEKIIKSRSRLYRIFTNTPAAIAVMRGPELTFETANPAFRKLVGTRRRLLNRPLKEAFSDLEADFLNKIVESGKNNKPFRASEYPVLLRWENQKEPTIKYMNFVFEPISIDTEQPDGLMVFAYEVTDMVNSRQKLIQSQERFVQLANTMPQIVWVADANGTIYYYNQRWYQYTKFKKSTPPPEIKWDRVVHPSDKQRVVNDYNEAISNGKRFELEIRMHPLDNPSSNRWFLVRSVPIKDTFGNVIRWFGTSTDIDDLKSVKRKQTELELVASRLNEQRAHLVELNNAKDDFISIASHQLRTPATGVKQYLGMLIEGYAGELQEDQLLFLKTAYESNERQIKIVDDLLKVATVDAGKVRPTLVKTDIQDTLKSIIEEQSGKFRDLNQTVTLQESKAPTRTKIDEKLIRMALENIIDNASKYSGDGKEITIAVKGSPSHIVIEVKDNGIGIARRDIEKIFQKFSRIDSAVSSAVGGTGLGLYWAKNIIDLHGGNIEVKSTLGKGTTFTITFPKL